jgi:hypothetical protein
LAGLTYVLPDITPDQGIFVIDTSDLFAALEGEGTNNRRSLDRVCKHLQIPTEYLHNAGNDAHVSFLSISSEKDFLTGTVVHSAGHEVDGVG